MAPHSQARRVGCRPPWDSWSPRDIQLCQTVEQLQQHETLDWGDVNLEQKLVVNNTGCQLPCHYREYSVYSLCTLFVQCVYSECTMCVQCVHSLYKMCAQCVYTVCTMCVQCVHSLYKMCVQCVYSVCTVCMQCV